jgi:chromosome segregation ATPase
MAAVVEKQERDRELNLYLLKNPHIDIKEELQFAKTEITEMNQQISELQYNLYSAKKEKDFLFDKVQELLMDNEKVKTDFENLRRDAQLSSNEYQTLKTNYESSHKYIRMLEAEQSHMKQKIIRLNEIAEQFMQQPEIVESAFTAATTGT